MYTVGADPELFLTDHSGNYISAHTYFKGEKCNPVATNFGAIQVDGTAVEFNIHPAKSKEEFVDFIGAALFYIKEQSSKFNLKPIATPTAHFNKEYFKTLPKFVKKLGCEPDYNIYTGKQTPSPSANTTMRTGAGHIHCGWGEYIDFDAGYKEKVYDIVHQLDAYLYVKSLDWDSCEERRTLYGKIGSHRPKHYGVEYRPLSNKWVESKELQEMVYEITKRSLDLYDQGHVLASDDRCHEQCLSIYNNVETNREYYLKYMEDTYPCLKL